MRDPTNRVRTAKKPTPKKRDPRGRGDGRTKLVPYGSGPHLDKLMDNLVRDFYYLFKGYEGPHPWGAQARPPQPEYRPLKVVDKQHGSSYRTLLTQYFKEPRVRARWFRTLSEIRDILKTVDPSNPKLKNKVLTDV